MNPQPESTIALPRRQAKPPGAARRPGPLSSIVRQPALLLMAAYFLASPFYILPSGSPQPADIVMVVLILTTALWTGLQVPRGAVSPLRALLLFVLYVCAVNVVWAVLTGNFTLEKKTSMLLHPIFFCYNGLAFAAYLALYNRLRARLLSATITLVAASVIVQAALANRFLSATSFRQELFFNNPNQLGYYVLLSATIVAIGSKYFKVNIWLQAVFFLAATYLVMLSLSNAAMLSLGILMVVAFARRFSVLVLTSVLLFGAFQLSNIGPTLIDNVALRLGRIGRTTDDTLAGRGYDRIPAHPSYLILGAGEGGFERFESMFRGELHSTLGTLLFSYGVVGTFLFFLFLVLLVGRRTAIYLYVAPVFIYGLTHQGLRFTHFWLLWAFLLCLLIEAKGRTPSVPRPAFHLPRLRPPREGSWEARGGNSAPADSGGSSHGRFRP